MFSPISYIGMAYCDQEQHKNRSIDWQEGNREITNKKQPHVRIRTGFVAGLLEKLN